MATTFGAVKEEVIRLIGDTVVVTDANPSGPNPIAGKQHSAEFLGDACRAALRAIIGRQWKSLVFDITSAGDSFELPAGLIEIEAVYDNDLTMFIPETTFGIGTELTQSATEGNSWICFPHGKITFANGLQASGAKVYYKAAWTPPVKDVDTFESPEFCLTAITLFAASYCFLRKSAQQSDLAQFKTKVDAGTPEDIPAISVGNNFLKRFENEMNRIPMKQKVSQ